MNGCGQLWLDFKVVTVLKQDVMTWLSRRLWSLTADVRVKVPQCLFRQLRSPAKWCLVYALRPCAIISHCCATPGLARISIVYKPSQQESAVPKMWHSPSQDLAADIPLTSFVLIVAVRCRYVSMHARPMFTMAAAPLQEPLNQLMHLTVTIQHFWLH